MRRVTITALLVLLGGGAARAAAFRVEAGELVVRARADAIAPALGRVVRGQVYAGLGLVDGWRRIQWSDQVGFVKDAGLAPTDFPVEDVRSGAAPVRRGPGRAYDVAGRLDGGDAVTVVGIEGEWRLIFHSGRRAFIHESHLAPERRRPTSAAGFIGLPAAGPGFYSTTTSGRRWGTPRLIYAMERIGLTLEREGRQRMGVGDVSLMNGGDIDGHVSHEKGVDVDVRLARRGPEGPGTIYDAAYDREGTRRLLVLFRREQRVQYIFFHDPTAIAAGLSTPWPNHANHFHVRVD